MNKLLMLNVKIVSGPTFMIYFQQEHSGISPEKKIFWLEDDISKAPLL